MIYLNNVLVKPTIFPDKTSQIWGLNIDERCVHHEIVWQFENEGELVHLAQLKALLYRLSPSSTMTLHLPYLPYGRQDKSIENDATFAVNVFYNLINYLGFNNVVVFDPHPIENFPKNWKRVTPDREIKAAIKHYQSDLVIFPDSGAQYRYKNVDLGVPLVMGMKHRVAATGDITELRLVNDDFEEIKDLSMYEKVLIVDDICDGGATFIKLAKLLKDMKIENIGLYVSHGLFTKGLNPLWEAGIEKVYDKYGMVDINPDFEV